MTGLHVNRLFQTECRGTLQTTASSVLTGPLRLILASKIMADVWRKGVPCGSLAGIPIYLHGMHCAYTVQRSVRSL